MESTNESLSNTNNDIVIDDNFAASFGDSTSPPPLPSQPPPLPPPLIEDAFGEFDSVTPNIPVVESSNDDDDGFGAFDSVIPTPPSLTSDVDTTTALPSGSSSDTAAAPSVMTTAETETTTPSSDEIIPNENDAPVGIEDVKSPHEETGGDDDDDDDDDDDFGTFNEVSPPPLPSSPPPPPPAEDAFGAFDTIQNDAPAAESIPALVADESTIPPALPTGEDKDDSFGDFGTFDGEDPSSPPETAVESTTTPADVEESLPLPTTVDHTTVTAAETNDDSFGDFGTVLPSSHPTVESSPMTTAVAPTEDDTSIPIPASDEVPPSEETTTAAAAGDDKDDSFGDFGTFDEATPPPPSPPVPPPTDAPRDDDDFGDFGSFEKTATERPPVVASPPPEDDAAESPPTEDGPSNDNDNTNDDDDDFGNFGTFDEAPPPVERSSEPPADDSFGDFGTFDESPAAEDVPPSKDTPPSKEDAPGGDDNELSKDDEEEEEDDDFGDFGEAEAVAASPEASGPTPPPPETSPTPANDVEDDDDDDDFGDFGTFDEAPPPSKDDDRRPEDDPFVAEATLLLSQIFVSNKIREESKIEEDEGVIVTIRSVLSSIPLPPPSLPSTLWSKTTLQKSHDYDTTIVGQEPPSIISISTNYDNTEMLSSTQQQQLHAIDSMTMNGHHAENSVTLGPRYTTTTAMTETIDIDNERNQQQQQERGINGHHVNATTNNDEISSLNDDERQIVEQIPDLTFLLTSELLLPETTDEETHEQGQFEHPLEQVSGKREGGMVSSTLNLFGL